MNKNKSRGCTNPPAFEIFENAQEVELSKTIIQVSFVTGTEEENNIIISKLQKMKNNLDEKYGEEYIVESCHLPRRIVEAKGFSTQIVDAFEDIFGEKYLNQVTADTFEEAMENMDKYRTELSLKANLLFIISHQKINGVAIELEKFTNNKIQVF